MVCMAQVLGKSWLSSGLSKYQKVVGASPKTVVRHLISETLCLRSAAPVPIVAWSLGGLVPTKPMVQ